MTETTASIWLETSGPAQVEVRAGGRNATARTFTAFSHHYALVLLTGLQPGADVSYEVLVDEQKVWPPADSTFPPSRIRTVRTDRDTPVRVIFGSCREGSPLTDDSYPPDALDTYARTLIDSDRSPVDRPDLLLMLGDQVYADETSPATQEFLEQRREDSGGGTAVPPQNEVGDFEEYTRLYYESWQDPEIRWLLSTVPTAMIFDDHEIVDDWNTSAPWRETIGRQPWWHRRITGGIASYWVYQHLGNLTPEEIGSDPGVTAVLAAEDATDLLVEIAVATDRSADQGTRAEQDRIPTPAVTGPTTRDPAPAPRWSYRLDLAGTRVVVLDNRAGRVLTPGERQMLSRTDWDWFEQQLRGDYDHLVIGASLPWLLPPAIHELETWNERLCDSPHRPVAAWAEWLRQFSDMEHWAAFRSSFERLGRMLEKVARGGYGSGRPPASISVLSGDVHHSYVAEALFGPETGSRVYQLTCSPTHNQAPPEMKIGFRLGWNRGAAAIGAGLARLAGVPRPQPSWERRTGPFFSNAIGTLELTGRAARVRLDGTERSGDEHPRLRPLAQVPLAWSTAERPDRAAATT